MDRKKALWLRLCLANLCIVALLGFGLRSKILFPIPFLDFRNLLSAHSHFAFGGWAGLSLITLLIYNVLPPERSRRKVYQWLLIGIETGALGMAFTFPFTGYGFLSIFFSTLYIFVSYVFAFVFLRDLARSEAHKAISILSTSAVLCLVISSIGPFGLAYILMTKSADSYLYRYCIYTFLHFQYNGFFSLALFALLFQHLVNKALILPGAAKHFAVFISASIIPTLFLSMLWQSKTHFYVIAAVGCIGILITLFYFSQLIATIKPFQVFENRVSRLLLNLSMFSFMLKMVLNIGTIFPPLGNAVYGDRPVIIGFLHLVFLGFISFYILAFLVEKGFFSTANRTAYLPVAVFSTGIILNELLLMLQGLGILFKTNSGIYNWLLWGASLFLLTGAFLMATFSQVFQKQKRL